MENKINIAELLKDCPKGMELDCPLFENLEFDHIDKYNGKYPIICRIKTEWGGYNTHPFTEYGCYNTEKYSKCVIFPKGKDTWEGFQRPFKDGDILATDLGSVFFLNTLLNSDERYGCYVGIGGDGSFHICAPFAYKECCGFATEEEKGKLFDAIKVNGYKWNAKTKTLEELPKFKVGDRIRHRVLNFTHRIMDIKDWYYIINETHLPHGLLPIEVQDHYELVPDKFDITTLKPFAEVLVRLTNNCVWMPKFFSHYDTESKMKYYPFITTDNIGYVQCIPYKGNEHLCRTTNDCDNFYKTWE